MEDLAGIYKRLSFFGMEIDAVHDGTADSIMVGIRGLIGQMQREDGAKKVRRGTVRHKVASRMLRRSQTQIL
jgi:hypothetical protein